MKNSGFRLPARGELLEIVGVGTIGGATASVITLAATKIADVGDLLGFVGAAVGAGLAVIGAIHVEDRKRIRDAVEYRTAVVRIIVSYIESCTLAIRHINSTESTERNVGALMNTRDRLLSAAKLVGMTSHRNITNPELFYMMYWFENDGTALAEEMLKLGTTERNFYNLRTKSVSMIQASQELATQVLNEINA